MGRGYRPVVEPPARKAKSSGRMTTQEEVYEALKDVQDPELYIGILDLGLVYGVEIAGEQKDDVTVTMTLTSPTVSRWADVQGSGPVQGPSHRRRREG